MIDHPPSSESFSSSLPYLDWHTDHTDPLKNTEALTVSTLRVESLDLPVVIVHRGNDLCVLGIGQIRKVLETFDLPVDLPRGPANPIDSTEGLRQLLSDPHRTPDRMIGVRVYGTPFQRHVWATLTGIRPGETLSYSQVAQRMDLTTHHARAVGHAVALNRLSIIVPCHRVIRSHGHIGSYAWGHAIKQSILINEGAFHPPFPQKGQPTS